MVSPRVLMLKWEIAMISRNQKQLSTSQMLWDNNILRGAETDSSRHVQADVATQAFSFGPFRIVPSARLIERDGSAMKLSSRAFDLLCLLVSRPGEVVSKGELIATTWPNVTVEESCLRFHITQLRRALGDPKGSGHYVKNIPGRGYCFIAYVYREALPLQHGEGRNHDHLDALSVQEHVQPRWRQTNTAAILHA